MIKVPEEAFRLKRAYARSLVDEMGDFRTHWRLLADYILPNRYQWLCNEKERRQRLTRNPNIIDGTGTQAARTLAAGLLNGITSPSRPWFRLRLKRWIDEQYPEARRWLDEVERRMLRAMAETNFYNAMAVMYLDLVIFGTAGVLIYEDYENVFRCYNSPLGEFALGVTPRQIVGSFVREYNTTVENLVNTYGEENLLETTRRVYKQGGASRLAPVKICHIIEQNEKDAFAVPSIFKYREIYFESSSTDGQLLSKRGYYERPGIFPRWEVTGNDAYGSCPGMDALADIIQLQHESKRKAQSLDYMNQPPTVADIQLSRKPTALLPGGRTFVQGINNVGVKPIYTVNPPIQEMSQDLRDIQIRISNFFFNDLFKMISQLETVRSATEIDARKEEKLVLLGPVLERNQNEGLDPAVNRIYNIMTRAGLLPPPPEGLEEEEIEIQYVSILSAAQSAVGVIPIERYLQVIGGVAPVYPGAVQIPNWDELLREYGRDIGVKSKLINSEKEVAAQRAAMAKQMAAQQAVEQVGALAQAGKTMSETDVGGGANALQMMLSG